MRPVKIALAAVVFWATAGCSFLSVRPVPLTTGPVFPLAEAQSISYSGQVIPPGLKARPYYFFATDRGHLVAVDVRSAAIVWDFKASFAGSRAVGLGQENVYLIDEKNILYCLDRSGWVRWSRGLAETAAGPLKEIDGRLYVGTEEGSLFCIFPQTGLDAWKFKTKAGLRTGALLWKDSRGRTFILCGGDEGKLFFLDERGELLGALDIGGKIALPPYLENDRLYIGTESHMFLCLGLERRRTKWRVRLTGRQAAPAVADSKRIFFLTAQGVLMCLSKRSGEILWWRALSSRADHDLELADGQILAAPLSADLVSFGARDGREAGRFRAGAELRSNPAWMGTALLVHIYDARKEEGRLIFLRRKEGDDEQK